MILFATVVLALLPALWCALPRSGRSVPFVASGGMALSLAAAILVAVRAADDGNVVALQGWISVDSFGALVVVLIAAVSCAATFYSIGEVAKAQSSAAGVRAHYANICLFAASMLVVAMSVEPALAWIAIALATLFSVSLTAYTDTGEALEAAWKYMTVALLGLMAALLGVLVLYWAFRTAGTAPFTYSGLASETTKMNATLVGAAFALLLVGFGTPAGLFPMHTWMPDVHGRAPAAVCAMISGIGTTVALYVLLRLSPVFFGTSGVHAEVWFAAFGLLSIAAAALLLLRVRDLKQLFAFSTMQNMGIVLLAASLATPAGNFGTVWQMVTHSVSKSLCFFAAGAVAAATGTTDLVQLRNVRPKAALPMGALFAGTLAISGVPAFALFLSELAIASAAIYAGELWLAAALLFFLGVAIAAVLPKIAGIVLGDGRLTATATILPVSATIVIFAALAAVLLLGLWMPSGLANLLTQAATQLASP